MVDDSFQPDGLFSLDTLEKESMIIKNHRVTEKWFEHDINHSDAFKFVVYKQFCGNVINTGFFVKKPFFTKLTDLTQNEGNLLKSLKKRTRYAVRKAEKDGVHFSEFNRKEISSYIEFYNKFAELKSLPRTSYDKIEPYINDLVFTQATHNGETIVIHAYLTDTATKRTRQFHSVSHHRADKIDNSLIGNANRSLHYYDMLYFKKMNYLTYDIGGYPHKTKDRAKENIRKFKDGFGGELTQEMNLFSYPIYLINIIKIFSKR